MTIASTNMSLEELDKLSLLHPVTSIADLQKDGPTIYSDCKGVRLRSRHGRSMIDMGAGLWCVNVGYGREEIADAAATAIRDLGYVHLFGGTSNEPAIRLADKVLSLMREQTGASHMARVFFGTSGSDANDTTFKLVRYYNNLRGRPGKKKIISRMGGYHGLTFASGSLTGIAAYHTAFDMPLPDVIHTSCPHFYQFAQDGESEEAFTNRMVAEIAGMIEREGADTIAAFIAEPVMGTGGVLLPPEGYFQKVQKLLTKHDILFIVDEVITGFGRLGTWFGTGAYDLKPDIINLAKGITSAYFPLSATVISDAIWETLSEASPRLGAVMHGFTYSGHPVGSAIALANIGILERENLPVRAADNGAYLLDRLRTRIGDNPFVGDIRGRGLMVGVEYVADKKTRRPFASATAPHKLIAKLAAEHGVVTRALPFMQVNSFSPPLSITREEIDEGVASYAAALEAAMPSLREMAR